MEIILEERLCDEAMQVLEDSGAKFTVDETLAAAETADALVLSGRAPLPESVYSAEAALRVLAVLGPENENFDSARATRSGLMLLEPRYGEAASVADYALYLLLEMARGCKEDSALELRGKTLGFVGFPTLAGEIARRAQGFGLKLLCYTREPRRGCEMLYHVENTSLVDLFVCSDFIMLLAEPSEWSRGLVGKDEIQLMKKDAGLISLTDAQIFRWEELLRALDWGYLANFAMDLPRSQEYLAKEVAAYGSVSVAKAARTREARLGNQIEIAKDVCAALSGAQVETATNIVQVHQANLKEGRGWCSLAHLLGVFLGQRLQSLPQQLEITVNGALPATESAPVVANVLAGFAEGLGAKKVNAINSNLWAEAEGLSVVLKKNASALKEMLHLSVETPSFHLQVAGDRQRGEDNIIQVDDYHLQGRPHEHILLVPHVNRPGVIGQVGTLMGEMDVNIAEMVLGHKKQDRTTALMWIQVEQPLARSISEESRKLASVMNMEYIYLPVKE